METARRHFLVLAGLSPLAMLSARSASAQAAACYDPEALPLSQKNRRRSIGYTDPSTDPKKHCGACTFFTAGEGGCGTCAILTGGPVSAPAVCNSFAPKAG